MLTGKRLGLIPRNTKTVSKPRSRALISVNPGAGSDRCGENQADHHPGGAHLGGCDGSGRNIWAASAAPHHAG